ncbi:endonuclease/exonuclease/phosphatase family protein [soil metagenome]
MQDSTLSQVRKPGFFKTSVLIFNLVAAALLLLSQVSPGFSPSRIWFMELVAMSYPFFLVLNIFFVFYWLLKFHRFLFISAAIIIMGYDKISQLYSPTMFRVDVMPPPGSIKIMSYNVRLFDLYNWSGNQKTRSKIFSYLNKEQPEVLCIQEYYSSEHPKNDYNNNDTIPKILKNCNSHIEYGVTLRKTDHWGLATFSKFPIVGKGKIIFEEGSTNFGMFTDVIYQDDTIRIYNVHLQSNHFKEEDMQIIDDPENSSKGQIFRGSKRILARLKHGAIKRSYQVDELKAHMQSSPYPYIVCGDFNDPPYTYAYQTLRKDLKDAFVDKGKGFGITFSGTIMPFRIDYILHQESFMTHRFQVTQTQLSDHYPITAWLTLQGKKKPKMSEIK